MQAQLAAVADLVDLDLDLLADLQDVVHGVDALAAHEAEPEEAYSIIREKRFSCKPSTVDEAILEMNMLGHTFFLFRDADTDEIHAVYRRKDGSYGVLIPER